MKYLKQFTIIIVFSFAGEALHALLPLPVPAGIYGIVLLFAALLLKVVRADSIRETADVLIVIMPVLFIPVSVGIISSWEVVKHTWLAALVISAVSTVLVMGAAGMVTQAVIRKGRRKGKHQEDQ